MTRFLPLVVAVGVVFLLSGSLGRAPRVAGAGAINRPEDPVVVSGANVAPLLGIAPNLVVAFKYSGGWQQIPVQVDERAVVDLGKVYNQAPSGVTVLAYTDAGTFTGADPDPTLDANDEIVFMAKDAGVLPPSFSEPAAVVANSGVRVTIYDPITADSGTVFLFRQDGTLNPAAGAQYVQYAFSLNSGAYLTTYNTVAGPNPENSFASSLFYSHHFSDRWANDQLRVLAGASTGVDILDRHKALFAPGNCVRSEDTFNAGEGAFIVNKSGPIRAIRSYIGANSGPNTQRDHFFYAQRQDIVTALRVHAIPSVMDFFDYAPAASGMKYYNDLNLSGVTIDGVPESPALGQIQWEMVTGAQGTIVMPGVLSTNIPGFAYTSYYLDNVNPPVTQCTGDAFAYGSSGVYVNQSIPCTDPGLGCTSFLKTTRTIYYEPPNASVAAAQGLSARNAAPLSSSTRAWTANAVGGISEQPRLAAMPIPPQGRGAHLRYPLAAAMAGALGLMGAFALLHWNRRNRTSRAPATSRTDRR